MVPAAQSHNQTQKDVFGLGSNPVSGASPLLSPHTSLKSVNDGDVKATQRTLSSALL